MKNCKRFDREKIKGMSTIIFASNQKSSRTVNQINEFEIELIPPIDARSEHKEIIVEEILYPNTLSTVHPRNKEEFQMKIEMKVATFMKKKNNNIIDTSTIYFKLNEVQVPYGHHSLKDLIIFLNKTLNLFNMSLSCVIGNKSVLTFHKAISYYSSAPNSFDGFDNNKYMKKSDLRVNNCDKYDMKVVVTLSSGLTRVLGFESNTIEFKIEESTTQSNEIEEYNGLYVMDPTYGLNFMNIICDKILPVQMGFEYKESLLICPLQLSDGNTKDNMISYIPKCCVRKLIPGMIHSIHFKVTDLSDLKLYFNSGKIILICTIN